MAIEVTAASVDKVCFDCRRERFVTRLVAYITLPEELGLGCIARRPGNVNAPTALQSEDVSAFR